MSPSLVVVETQDLVAASRMLRLWVADPVAAALSSLARTLDATGAMAGSDPGGLAWAREYDGAAPHALQAAADAVNTATSVAAMFAQTARNYAAAEAASTAAPLAEAAIGALPADAAPFWLPVCRPAPAAGGSGGGPAGWGLIAHLVGYVWPDGHQDRLRAAAAAWRASAAALEHGAGDAIAAAGLAISDQLPEAPHMWRVCHRLSDQLRDLAGTHNELGSACEALAQQLDEAHSAIIAELISLVEWTAGIEAVGGLLSVITFGAAGGVSQAAEAARIGHTATRVGLLIERFIAAAEATAQTIATLAVRIDHIAAELAGIKGIRLTEAAVLHVRTTPTALRLEHLLAERRFPAAAGLPALVLTRQQVEAKFKHAAALGVTEGRGRAGFHAFDAAIRRFFADPKIKRVLGTYRGRRMILNYSITTRVAVLQDLDGTFVSAWKLSQEQALYVVRDRSLGGA